MGISEGKVGETGRRRGWRAGAGSPEDRPGSVLAAPPRVNLSYVLYKRYHRPGESTARPHSMALPSPSDEAVLPEAVQATPSFSPLYQQIKGLILQSLEAGE